MNNIIEFERDVQNFDDMMIQDFLIHFYIKYNKGNTSFPEIPMTSFDGIVSQFIENLKLLWNMLTNKSKSYIIDIIDHGKNNIFFNKWKMFIKDIKNE